MRRVFALAVLACVGLQARPQHSHAAWRPSNQLEQATCNGRSAGSWSLRDQSPD